MKFVLCVRKDRLGRLHFDKGIDPISNEEGYYVVSVIEENEDGSKFNYIKHGALRIASKEWVLENQDKIMNLKAVGNRIYPVKCSFAEFIERYDATYSTMSKWGCYTESIEYLPSGKNLVYTFNAPSLYKGALPFGRGKERVDVRIGVEQIMNGSYEDIAKAIRGQKVSIKAFVDKKVKQLEEDGIKGYSVSGLRDTAKNINLHIDFMSQQIERLGV